MTDPTSNKMTVATVARLLVSASTTRTVALHNKSTTVSVFLGGADVAASGASEGFELLPGASVILDRWSSSLYGITSSTADVQVLEGSCA